MPPLFYLLAQMDDKYLSGLGEPPLQADYSYGLTYVIAFVLIAAILLITFKTSSRNHLERE